MAKLVTVKYLGINILGSNILAKSTFWEFNILANATFWTWIIFLNYTKIFYDISFITNFFVLDNPCISKMAGVHRKKDPRREATHDPGYKKRRQGTSRTILGSSWNVFIYSLCYDGFG